MGRFCTVWATRELSKLSMPGPLRWVDQCLEEEPRYQHLLKKLPGCSNIQSRLGAAAWMNPAVCIVLPVWASEPCRRKPQLRRLNSSYILDLRPWEGFQYSLDIWSHISISCLWPPQRGLFYPFSFFSNLLSSSVQSHLAGEFTSSFTGDITLPTRSI